METNKNKFKIMFMIPPATGHVNPICSIANELCKRENISVVIYSDEKYRVGIEKTGAQFRAYSHTTYSKLPEEMLAAKTNLFCLMLDKFITYSYDLLPQLIADVESDQPDLIIYDWFFVTAKYLLKILKVRNRLNRMPKSLMFFPNFAVNEKIGKMFGENSPIDMWMPFSLGRVFIRQFRFSWSYGLSTYNPLTIFMEKHDEINIVGVMPELQLFHDEFDSTYKFIGSCVSEEARRNETNDTEIDSLLDQRDSSIKLVYMSLGTVFNSNYFIFERSIDAFKNFDQPGRHYRSDQFRVIISVGEYCLKILGEKIAKKELTVPPNIILRARVAQLEVLKKCHLFISHCGMNSTNEAIKYAVPLVAIPIEGDQHVVAKRVCDELELGVRLQVADLTENVIGDAVDRVLSDDKYLKNIREMSEVSRKYNGPENAAQIIVNYLDSNKS